MCPPQHRGHASPASWHPPRPGSRGTHAAGAGNWVSREPTARGGLGGLVPGVRTGGPCRLTAAVPPHRGHPYQLTGAAPAHWGCTGSLGPYRLTGTILAHQCCTGSPSLYRLTGAVPAHWGCASSPLCCVTGFNGSPGSYWFTGMVPARWDCTGSPGPYRLTGVGPAHWDRFGSLGPFWLTGVLLTHGDCAGSPGLCRLTGTIPAHWDRIGSPVLYRLTGARTPVPGLGGFGRDPPSGPTHPRGTWGRCQGRATPDGQDVGHTAGLFRRSAAAQSRHKGALCRRQLGLCRTRVPQ